MSYHAMRMMFLARLAVEKRFDANDLGELRRRIDMNAAFPEPCRKNLQEVMEIVDACSEGKSNLTNIPTSIFPKADEIA